ncbi:integral membrane protein [Viridothelium virens]|uniref:Integral membrane protein n=1 Tax=Viridothelium virens TaxID=1048519 RepID=A0A6A6HPJ3_VIRVR|nr:integral membrane protein [Viridothelium virens]
MKPRNLAYNLLWLLLPLSAVEAAEIKLDQKPQSQQTCSGMYGKKAWGGSVDPFILTTFVKPDGPTDAAVSLVIFEWNDADLVGKPVDPAKPETRQMYCDETAIGSGVCSEEQRGQFIILPGANQDGQHQIVTQAIELSDPPAINYPVSRTGYYCVSTFPFDGQDYTAVVEFRNAYGELPAAQVPKLPFYGGLTIVYAVVGIYWGFLYFQNRRDVLAVQNYITAILAFLVIEMLTTWGFYDYSNRMGNNAGAKVLMILVSIFNSLRNSFSFFLLLIVCMGYGVVKPSLGKTMIYVRWLAITHFVFGVIYAIASLLITPEDAGPLVLFVILPLSATLTAFYIWTLNSLNMTLKDLMERKQTVKASMYRKLWWCILASIIVIFGFFFLNSLTFAGVGDVDFAPTHWKYRWFILDGWLNVVYLFDIAFVAYIWRPTANNRRFAMSDEIAQDDEGFEIASIRDSLDEEEGLQSHPNGNARSAYDPVRPSNRDFSPLPAPRPTKPMPPPRESLEDETIFAVGDEGDKFSDDEGPSPIDADERKRLTAKDD